MKASLNPVASSRGDVFYADDVAKVVVNSVNTGDLRSNHEKELAIKQTKKGLESLDDLLKMVSDKRDEMLRIEEQLTAMVRKSGANLRQAAEKIGQSFERFEKNVNLTQLADRADSIERIANAMSVIAELHDSGKLEKIGNMLKGGRND